MNNNDLFIINLSQQIVGFLYVVLAITFVILLAINITWIVTNIVFWAFNGLQALLVDPSVIESIYLSTFLKWILLGDIIWIASALTFAFMRKDYRTDPKEHYLVKKPLDTQTMCVVLPAYNEELSIESVVKDFINFKNVKQVIVVDNDSSDKTVEIAEKDTDKFNPFRTKSTLNNSNTILLYSNPGLDTNKTYIIRNKYCKYILFFESFYHGNCV